MRHFIRGAILAAGLVFPASFASAQGEDSTIPERNLQIISALLAGEYNNANQAYFDVRTKRPEDERHDNWHLTVERAVAAETGEAIDNTFIAELDQGDDDAEGRPSWRYVLSADNEVYAVRMQVFARSAEGETALSSCDLLWHMEAGQFRAALETPEACEARPDTVIPAGFLLSEDALWMSDRSDPADHYALERARLFQCYIDVPGVAGGRDEPYKRYPIEAIHDKGGEEWITTDGGLDIGVNLFALRWAVNNLEGIFTRHSFVMYVKTREDGEAKEVAYTWTEPTAQRIGMNLKWALVNCYMQSNEEVEPFFREEPTLQPWDLLE